MSAKTETVCVVTLWSDAVKAACKEAREAGGHLPGRFIPDAPPLIQAAVKDNATLSYVASLSPNATRKERSEAEKADKALAAAADSILKAMEAGCSMSSILAEAIRENKARAVTKTDARLFAPAVDRARAVRGE